MVKSGTSAVSKPIGFKGYGDLPLMPSSLGSMEFNPTGTWKYIEPVYRDKTPPCNADCPTGQDIVIQLALSAERRFDEALDILRMANPFPAVTGRVCPRPCESRCNREQRGGVISIRRIERFLGDYGISRGIRCRPEGSRSERIAVVGSGPAGLSCAFHLGRKGCRVTVHEALDVIGGLPATGIPDFRLPKDVLAAELKIFEELPVEFRTGVRLGGNLRLEDLRRSFDAVFIAVGRYRSRRMNIDGERSAGVLSGIELLRRIKSGKSIEAGKQVIVVGGGNTALDCARSLMRLGRDVRVVYRRSASEMPAFPDDIAEAHDEGVPIEYLVAPVKIVRRNDGVLVVELVRMTLGEPDESGRRRPVPVPHSEYVVTADAVVTALGEECDTDGLPSEIGATGGGIPVSGEFMTEMRGVFAGGDCAGGQGTVSDAIGRGRMAAAAIEAFFEGKPFHREHLAQQRGASEEIVTFDKLNFAHIPVLPGSAQHSLPPSDRAGGFREIHGGLTEDGTTAEARRCISCGTCTLCDNCRVFCPDVSIRFVGDGSGYEIDYHHCKGCGICVKECPRSAMEMRQVLGASRKSR